MEETSGRMRQAEPRIRIGDISSRAAASASCSRIRRRSMPRARRILPLTTGAGLTGQRDWDIEVVDGNRFVLTRPAKGIEQAIDQAMDSATEVVRKRIDALGTREPTIIRQGANRIVVQVPGLRIPAALKACSGRPPSWNSSWSIFPPADDGGPGHCPSGQRDRALCRSRKRTAAFRCLAVKRLWRDQGRSADQCGCSNDRPQTNEPIVSITFDQAGGAKFAKLTTENVNKPFAIILDGKVLSAPNINEPILGGRRADFRQFHFVETANQLAISLRSGALPVDLKVVEERSVGPTLAPTRSEKGMIAFAVGTARADVLHPRSPMAASGSMPMPR
jgi:preprotein translocase subunit SecD